MAFIIKPLVTEKMTKITENCRFRPHRETPFHHKAASAFIRQQEDQNLLSPVTQSGNH